MKSRTHISAKVVAKTQSKGQELISVLMTYPLFIHAEVLRHRNFASSVQSNRAVSFERNVKFLNSEGCVLPIIGTAQKGMVDSGLLEESNLKDAYERIQNASYRAIIDARSLVLTGVHHSIANRYLAPYLPCAHLMTGLDIWWNDFFAQRIKPDAERNIQALAVAVKEAIESQFDSRNEIHIPFYKEVALKANGFQRVFSSVAKCARVSYANYEVEKSPEKELEFVRKLWQSKHVSPFEHVCYPREWFSNEHCNLNQSSPFGNAFVSLRHLVGSPTTLGKMYADLLS